MSLPLFPEFKLVEIEDRDGLAAAIARHPSPACEFHFANIFLWRHYEHSKFTLINGNICILCGPPAEPAYFLQPIGETEVEATVRTCLTFAPRLSRVTDSFALRHGGPYRSEPDRDNFDYVYRTEDLTQLKGKRYDGKRNRIRKFERGHAYEYARYCRSNRPGCLEVLARWVEAKAAGDSFIGRVWKRVIEEALERQQELGLRGGVFRIDGRIVAFSFGSRLTGDTAVIPIEIVDPGYDGLSQLVNREFVRREWSDCRYINREQDNGIPGLRRAKTSYHPHHFVSKYNIWA
ncbi:MAG: GNAT family N-acetyltransferase [Candidatus Aminicenantales bacterium]